MYTFRDSSVPVYMWMLTLQKALILSFWNKFIFLFDASCLWKYTLFWVKKYLDYMTLIWPRWDTPKGGKYNTHHFVAGTKRTFWFFLFLYISSKQRLLLLNSNHYNKKPTSSSLSSFFPSFSCSPSSFFGKVALAIGIGDGFGRDLTVSPYGGCQQNQNFQTVKGKAL